MTLPTSPVDWADWLIDRQQKQNGQRLAWPEAVQVDILCDALHCAGMAPQRGYIIVGMMGDREHAIDVIFDEEGFITAQGERSSAEIAGRMGEHCVSWVSVVHPDPARRFEGQSFPAAMELVRAETAADAAFIGQQLLCAATPSAIPRKTSSRL